MGGRGNRLINTIPLLCIMYTEKCCVNSLFEDVLRVHPSVVFGQFDGDDDTGEQEDAAQSQSKPERVLEKTKNETFLFTV